MPGKPRKNTRQEHEALEVLPEGLALMREQSLRLADEHLREREDWQEERGRLLEEVARLRAMIDQVPDYLFVKNLDCRFIVANVAVAADLGRNPSSILGATDADLHPQDRAAEFLADDHRVLTSGQALIDKEEFIIRPNGEPRWLSTSKVPLRNKEGAVVGLVGVARDITLRKSAEEQVRFLAYFDPLTGLPNRSSFEQNLERVASSLKPEREARLMLVDLDRFKQVNDTLGHAAGDDLLQQVARRMSQLIGDRGHVARLGGDEFVLLLAFDAVDDETLFYDLLVRTLAIFNIVGNEVHVGASVGIAKIRTSTQPLAALREADIALYNAKAGGRNRWKLFEGEMAYEVERRQRLEAEMRSALPDGDQFVMHYQPIFFSDDLRVAGVEALVRWMHPELGLLGPDQFIPLAEERGLISSLGDLVVRRARDLLARTRLPWVAINVSPIQLRDPQFPDRVLRALDEVGVSRSRLQLEITEGVVLEDFGHVAPAIERLRAAGIRIAVDDFGTGYSSLSYLGRISVDKIKIDRSFVKAIGNPSGDAIVRAIIAFARALDLTVTAEGVETDEQRRFLREAGCHKLQGYLLARPVPEDQLSDVVGSEIFSHSRSPGWIR